MEKFFQPKKFYYFFILVSCLLDSPNPCTYVHHHHLPSYVNILGWMLGGAREAGKGKGRICFGVFLSSVQFSPDGGGHGCSCSTRRRRRSEMDQDMWLNLVLYIVCVSSVYFYLRSCGEMKHA